MIIDHNRSLPKSGRPHLSTPNKSPSPLPHKPTPQQTAKSQQVHTHQSDESTTDTIKTETTPSDPLLAMVHRSINTSDDDASDISNVLSVKRSRQIQVCQCYPFQHANHTNQQLVDCGANGGLAGSDMRDIHKTHRKINIPGIDNHEVTRLDVVTVATLLNTSQGKVIGIFNEYAYLGKGSSIHSSGQLEWFKTNVDERTTTNQCLASASGEGTTFPFPIPYPQQPTNSLPHDPLDESTPNFEQFVNSQSGEDEDNPIHMANIDIPNLLGRSFLLPPEDNGERHIAKIIDIDDHGQPLEDTKFKLKINKDQAEDIMSYNQLMDYIQKGTDAEEDPDSLFKFRDIVAHQGPLASDPDHKGSQ